MAWVERMSVKIYDSTIGAFKDAETPLIWDEQAQAWKDSVGLVWNESAQAWEERWGAIKSTLYLYNEGDECTDVTGGWQPYAYRMYNWGIAKAPSVSKGSKSITVSMTANSTQNRGVLMPVNKTNTDGYKRVCFHIVSATISEVNQSTGVNIHTGNIFNGYTFDDIQTVLVVGQDAGGKVTDKIVTVEFNSLEEKNIAVVLTLSQGDTASITFDKVWLEK